MIKNIAEKIQMLKYSFLWHISTSKMYFYLDRIICDYKNIIWYM